MPRWGASHPVLAGRFGDREALHRGIFILECLLINEILFGGVCSGISAPAVAWHPLGWRAVWEAEIEDFPSKVLAHHYPDVPNLGDMTKIAAMIRARLVAAPDVLVGGTPCQAFSVAGTRNSLEDARGQLTLSYVELADEIDRIRIADGKPECIIVWENVPGVLSTKDNAFGCFLAGLAGEDCPLVPPGGKWPNAGCVYGPKRTVAWRVTDAQYFDVAQRRARVFVVASAREGFDPAEVLFEFDGVRRDSPPSREAREEIAGTLTSSLGVRRGQPDCGSTSGQLQPVRVGGSALAFGGNNQAGPIDIATARNACSSSSSGRLDFESETFVVQPVVNTLDASYGRLQGCSGQDANHGHSHLVPIAFDSRQDTVSSQHVFGALGTSSPQAQAVAFQSSQSGVRLSDTHATLDANNGSRRHNGVLAPVCITGDVTHTLKAEGFDASEDGTGRGQPIISYGWAVRRLMPVECERLQAFPDNYTLIPVKKAKKRSKMFDYAVIDGQLWQLAADGPRYKALGNSMCVYNMRWIGQRIQQHLANPFGDLL